MKKIEPWEYAVYIEDGFNPDKWIATKETLKKAIQVCDRAFAKRVDRESHVYVEQRREVYQRKTPDVGFKSSEEAGK